MIEFPDLIGSIGLLLILVPFILYELNKLNNKSLSYNIMNLLGALILIWYSVQLRSTIFTLLNLVWAVFALYVIGKIVKHHIIK
ncbi:hypothetical protein ACFLZ7_03555 [Nanoarchaeota archaeon]